jgi:hypothetical protein
MATGRGEEALWRTIRANDYKVSVGIAGFASLAVTVVGAVLLWAFGVPFLPPSLIDYGWLFHVPHIIFWAAALTVSNSQSTELVTLVAALAVPTVLLDLWVVIINFVPWLIGCITGSPVSWVYDCVVSAVYMIVLTVLALLALLTTVFILYYTLALLAYINRSRTGSAAAATTPTDDTGKKGV